MDNEKMLTRLPEYGGATGSDLRSPLAKARDGFMLSQVGEELCAGATSGQYLRNRIEAAWLAGTKWGQAHPCPNKKLTRER